ELYLSRSDADVHAAAAAAAFAALGDVDATAQAEILHARVLRGLGRSEDAEAAAERAFALVRDRPPSRVKAAALIGWSAALSISLGRYQEAAECAREGLAIAEQLELVPLQVDALNRLGLALSALDEGGEAELERAVQLGRGGVAPDAMQGAYANLMVAL